MTSTDTTSPLIVDDQDEVGLRFDLAHDHVGVLTLDRPAQFNAVNWSLYNALATALHRVSQAPDIRVLVLRGEGKAFCAGGDIAFMRQMFEGEIDMHDVQALALRFFRELHGLPQPTIAIVDGPAVGFGATIALTCDVVYASERSTFADPHVQMGLVAGDGGGVLWPLLLGPGRARELLFTGDPISAVDAFTWGMIAHVHPTRDEVEAAGMALAQRLARGPVEALRATKAITNHLIRSVGEEVIRGSLAMELASQTTLFHQQAVERFLQGSAGRF